jgi:hypothetical protein
MCANTHSSGQLGTTPPTGRSPLAAPWLFFTTISYFVQEAVFVQSRAVAGAHHQRQALDVNHEYSIAATITHGPDGAAAPD